MQPGSWVRDLSRDSRLILSSVPHFQQQQSFSLHVTKLRFVTKTATLFSWQTFVFPVKSEMYLQKLCWLFCLSGTSRSNRHLVFANRPTENLHRQLFQDCFCFSLNTIDFLARIDGRRGWGGGGRRTSPSVFTAMLVVQRWNMTQRPRESQRLELRRHRNNTLLLSQRREIATVEATSDCIH